MHDIIRMKQVDHVKNEKNILKVDEITIFLLAHISNQLKWLIFRKYTIHFSSTWNGLTKTKVFFFYFFPTFLVVNCFHTYEGNSIFWEKVDFNIIKNISYLVQGVLMQPLLCSTQSSLSHLLNTFTLCQLYTAIWNLKIYFWIRKVT